MRLGESVVLFIAAIPFIYYLISLYSAARFFRTSKRRESQAGDFSPPVSNLKPVRGLDPEAYENFASYCKQDYPEYELLFCVGDSNDPTVPVIEKLIADFPERRIRLIFSNGHNAINDKVAKLNRLVAEAKYEVLVINDADVRVRPDYLRSVVGPLREEKVGAVTCMYVSAKESTFSEKLQAAGMISDFFPGILVAWQLDGVKFAFGQTIVTTRSRIRNFGGYETIENRPADDLLVGRLIAEEGYTVELLPYVVHTVADFESFGELLHKRVRWMTVMRHMRPWGHLGLVFTWGLPWSLAAVAVHPSAAIALAYLSAYGMLRAAMTWQIGVWGLKQHGIWKKLVLIPVWDALAFLIWLASFARRTIRWRGVDYLIQGSMLVPVTSAPAQNASSQTTGS